MFSRTEQRAGKFVFERDAFAFANELVWEYRLNSDTGRLTTVRSDPPPTYWHRCFVMVRSARQFRYHARFEPSRPVADAPTYQRLIRQVVKRNPRRPSAEPERIIIPGYDGLRSFSQAQEPLLKGGCGGPWEGYFLRSHWRMVFPVWRGQQKGVAEQLGNSLRQDGTPIVHLFRFPHITINHGIVLFDAQESEDGIRFEAYDPNIPSHPTELTYSPQARTFSYPRNHYWAGGALSVIEVFSKWPY